MSSGCPLSEQLFIFFTIEFGHKIDLHYLCESFIFYGLLKVFLEDIVTHVWNSAGLSRSLVLSHKVEMVSQLHRCLHPETSARNTCVKEIILLLVQQTLLTKSNKSNLRYSNISSDALTTDFPYKLLNKNFENNLVSWHFGVHNSL